MATEWPLRISGAELRSFTGWDTVDFVRDSDRCYVHENGDVRWTDTFGQSQLIGAVHATQLEAIARNAEVEPW